MTIKIVYWSSKSGNTKRFVEKLGVELFKLPLSKQEDVPVVDFPYILITPTYGGGGLKGAIPPAVIAFLNNPVNRQRIVGVVSMGNTNFGSAFCLAGRIISEKCGVPNLFNVEIFGTEEDVEKVKGIIEKYGK